MPAGDFRIPIRIDFSDSIRSLREFRAAFSQALRDIPQPGTIGASGRPISAAQVTSRIIRQAGAAQFAASEQGRAAGWSEAEIAREHRRILREAQSYARNLDLAAEAISEEKVGRRRAEYENRRRRAEERWQRALDGAATDEERDRILRRQAAAERRRAYRPVGVQQVQGGAIPRPADLQRDLRLPDEEIAGRVHERLQRLSREIDERTAVEQAITRNTGELLSTTAALNAMLRARRAVEEQATRTAARNVRLPDGRTLGEAEVDTLIGREQDRASRTVLAEQRRTNEQQAALGAEAASRRRQTARRDAAATRENKASEDFINATAEAAENRRQIARLQHAEQRRLVGGAVPFEPGTSRMQRIQAAIASRQGGGPRFASDYLTGSQLIASRLMTTASFAASGALLYGGVQFIREMVTEATELEQEFAIVRGMMEAVGETGEEAFGRVRDGILDAARAAGVQADVVASVSRQLAGAFADEAGVPDFDRGIAEATRALQFGRITGLPTQEITDSMTAISLSFRETLEDGRQVPRQFEEIQDTVVGLARSFGVSETEIVRFTADLAPLGSELGFTTAQLAALGAVAQQVSGRAGGALAEQFGRILPGLQQRAGELIALFNQSPSTRGFVQTLITDLTSNNLPGVLRTLVGAYGELNTSQRNQLATLVGGRREAAAFYAILENGQKTINALNIDGSQFEGQFERRWQAFQDTAQYAFDQVERAVEELGIALFQSGIAEGLATIAGGMADVADAAGVLLGLFSELNDVTGGLSGQLIGAALTFAIISKLVGMTRGVIGLLRTAGVLGAARAGGGAFAPGGLLAATSVAPGTVVPGIYGPPVPTVTPRLPYLASRTGRIGGFVGSIARSPVGGALATAAPILAAVAALEVKSALDDMNSELDEGISFIRSEVQKALERGVSARQIRETAQRSDEEYGGGGIGGTFRRLARDVAIALPGGTAKRGGEEAIDELQRTEAELRERQLAFLKNRIESTVLAPELLARLGARRQGPTQVLVPDIATTSEELRGQLDTLLERFKDEPTNDAYAQLIDDLVFQAAGNDTELAKGLRGIAERINARNRKLAQQASALRHVADPHSAQSLADALQDYQSGALSFSELRPLLERELGYLDEAIAAARDQGAEGRELVAQLLQQRADLERTLHDAVVKSIIGPIDLKERIREATGQGTAGQAATAAELQAAVSDLEGLDPGEQLDASLRVLDLLSRIAADKDLTTFRIPPNVRKALLAAQVRGGVGAENFSRIARLLEVDIDKLGTLIANGIIQFANDNTSLSAYLIAQQKKLVLAKIKAAEAVGSAQGANYWRNVLSNLDAQQKAIEGELDAGRADLFDPGSTGNVPTETEDPEDKARQIAEARLAIRRALAAGDPVKEAQLAIEAADLAADFARAEGDEAGVLNAIAQRFTAMQQLRDALADIDTAQGELRVARISPDNALARAREQAANAARAVALAKGAAARIRAQIAQIDANRALRDAIRDTMAAEVELAVAVANAAGNTIGAIRLQLNAARRERDRLKRSGAGEAEIDRARAEVVNLEAQLRDERLNEKLTNIDFLLEMERISINQAIQMLTALMQLAGTPEQRRDLERRIKQLRDQVNSDLEFNLPDFKLPTLYEVRRLMQATGPNAPAGSSSYQDNRTISMGPFYISNEVDAAQVIGEMEEIVNGAPITGNFAGAY